jgi:hypothetical protein
MGTHKADTQTTLFYNKWSGSCIGLPGLLIFPAPQGTRDNARPLKKNALYC